MDAVRVIVEVMDGLDARTLGGLLSFHQSELAASRCEEVWQVVAAKELLLDGQRGCEVVRAGLREALLAIGRKSGG